MKREATPFSMEWAFNYFPTRFAHFNCPLAPLLRLVRNELFQNTRAHISYATIFEASTIYSVRSFVFTSDDFTMSLEIYAPMKGTTRFFSFRKGGFLLNGSTYVDFLISLSGSKLHFQVP